MPTVIIRKYSTFFDPVTNTQFNPVLDVAAGVYIGVAQVDSAEIGHFLKNPAYEVVGDDEYASLATGKPVIATSRRDQKIRADIAALTADVQGAAAD